MTPRALGCLAALSIFALGACSSPEGKAERRPSAESAPSVAGPGDVEAGRRAFGQCRSCHAIEAGVTRVGPSLFGVVGRRAGTVEGYAYSTAMKASGLTWAPDTLDAYLENPHRMVKGTRMSLAGIPDSQRRRDIVAYLETLD